MFTLPSPHRMDFFKQLFSDLLSKESVSTMQETALEFNEPIERNELFKEAYQRWLDKEIVQSMLDDLNLKWQSKRENPSSSANFQEHKSPLSNGFFVHTENPWDDTDYVFLTNFWINKLISQGYILKRAHRDVCEEGGLLKGKESFYLKPSLKFRRESPYQQLYGNVEIEYRTVNGEGRLLKVLANTYSDRAYAPARSFEELLQFIFVL